MNYPFKENENTMAIVCNHILYDKAQILYASHDEDDGIWQFLCGGKHNVEDGRIISLKEVWEIDNSIAEIASMPLGYVANRKTSNNHWVKQKR